METYAKPYIFPDGKYDPATVPTPWFDFLEGKPKDQWDDLFYQGVQRAKEWFMVSWDMLDDEDRGYAINLFLLMGNPLWKHEALNYMAIMRQFISEAEPC